MSELDRYQQRIEAAFLVRCPIQSAYDWLYERRYTGDQRPFMDAPSVLEYLLVRRNDPLIDLGIARFGHSGKAIRQVFRRGNVGVRCAALANPHIGPFRYGWLQQEDLRELIRHGTDAGYEALAKNRFLTDDALEHLLERKEEFAELSEMKYLQMLFWLGENARMAAPYRGPFDGWAEYHHGRVFSLAWDLARHLPTTPDYAGVLGSLLQNTAVPVRYDEPETVIARWKTEEESEEGKRFNALSYFVRSRLADVLQADDNLLNSDDSALRESFYRRFSPWQYKDWPTFIERDGKLAFDAIVENDKLWSTAEHREALGKLAWKVPDSDMDAANTYDAVADRKRTQHPEWFADADAESRNELLVYEIIHRLETKFDEVHEAAKDNRDDLSQSVREATEKLERLERTLEEMENHAPERHNDIVQEIQELRTALLDQPAPVQSQVVPTWIWIVGIALLVLIFLK